MPLQIYIQEGVTDPFYFISFHFMLTTILVSLSLSLSFRSILPIKSTQLSACSCQEENGGSRELSNIEWNGIIDSPIALQCVFDTTNIPRVLVVFLITLGLCRCLDWIGLDVGVLCLCCVVWCVVSCVVVCSFLFIIHCIQFPTDILMRKMQGGGTVRTWDIPPEAERLSYYIRDGGIERLSTVRNRQDNTQYTNAHTNTRSHEESNKTIKDCILVVV
mmetsp:Transcript_53361/g.57963  ORF Transcript_53361/g.57963 Transcript_53361/m.57963 type:complete len:218 (+) Transcript_53361:42-695(+)